MLYLKSTHTKLYNNTNMKKLILLSILTISFVMNCSAQDKKASDLKKLFELMKAEKMIDGMMESMIPMMKQQANGKIMDDNAKEKYDKHMGLVMNEMKELSKKIINEEMPLIYDKHFTHKDIKQLIKFYKSPIGQKMLDKTPELTKDLMNSIMTKQMPELQDKFSKKLMESK